MDALNAKSKMVHDSAIIIDGHNDHVDLKYHRGEPLDFMKVARRFHSDGPRLLKGGMTATLMMVGGEELHPSLEMIEIALREIERNPDSLLLIEKTADIRRAKRSGRLGIMLTWESCTALGSRIDVLHAAHRLGVRAATTTHGEGGDEHTLQGTRSPFGYCTEAERAAFRRSAKGLTAFGREVVQEMNGMGMLVDLAHANDATVDDVLESTIKPVVSTHGGVFSCSPHYRCSTDEQIRGIAFTGGLISIAFYDKFVAGPNKKATVMGIVDQIEHVADLVGVKHVAIGSDFDGLPQGVKPVIPTADQLPGLTQALLKRGFSSADVHKVLGGNYLRVLRETIG